MRSALVGVLGIAILACLTFFPVHAQEKKAPRPEPTIDELVTDLGNPVYAVREKAQRELWTRGEPAIPALEKALKDENPEVVRRARELLDKFSWGVRPDTPPEVLKILRRFQAGDPSPEKAAEVRKNAVLDLLKVGPKGISVARALLGKNFSPETREQLLTHATAVLRQEVPRRLVEGQLAEAAELIDLHAAGTNLEGAADYTTFQLLNKSVTHSVVLANANLLRGNKTANQKLLLAHLHRANRDWEPARFMAADVTEGSQLIEQLREDEGDWGKLADTLQFGGMNHPDAVRLSMLRLAGRTKEFDDAARQIARAANEFSSAEELFDAAVALFANHRAEEATRILHDRKQNLGLLTEVLIARLKYKEALELFADRPGKELSPQEKLAFDLRRGRVLMLTGRRDEAVQLFGSVADQLRDNSPEKRQSSFNVITATRALLRAEVRAGLNDLAAEHAAGFVGSGLFQQYEQSASGESAFEILFGQDASSAETLFNVLRTRKIPGEQAGPTMSRVRELLAGKAGKNAVDEALTALRDTGVTVELPRTDLGQQSRRLMALAAVCRSARRDAEAEDAFKSAAEAVNTSALVAGARTWAFGVSDAYRPYVEWGDFLAARGKHREAANRLFEGWKRFPDQPLLLFLSGKSLAHAGNAKEGTRRMDLSHWVALGQERIRGKFLDELMRRGEAAAARREVDLFLRGCWPRDHYFGNVMNQASQAAALNRDFHLAEQCRQRSLLVILKTPDVFFVETSAYMMVPHNLLIYRARARLTDGKLDEATELARQVLAITPGHTDLISAMVPELERRGKKSAADEIFGIGWSAYKKVLADYPESAAARHSLALLTAGCGRELDRGLEYALEAVKSEPTSVAFRESLAELHFRKKDREKATVLMRKLVEEVPRSWLYQRQLERYRTGAFDSPKPDRAD